ncbi:MAG: adenylyl-sulfate kinase [Vicinamibacterales bacterium]
METGQASTWSPGASPRRGVCVWLTGLSGSGKTTTALALGARLAELGYATRLLDGDEIRRTLSPDLGFSRTDRDANVLRVASLAKASVDSGAIVLCALISPYRAARRAARDLIGADAFVEVFVECPLAVCEARDPKGLYARARRGSVSDFTGIDAPYEPPTSADLVLRTEAASVDENAGRVVELLSARFFAPGAPVARIAG